MQSKLNHFPFLIKRKHKFSQILPRSSMIAAHHRFTYREETNRKITKIK